MMKDIPKKNLLLHACCAPCLTSSLEQVSDYETSIFWYNPNIEPKAEHDKRLETLYNYLEKTGARLEGASYDYEQENQAWRDFIKGTENEPEGGKRCEKCIRFRLDETKKRAMKFGFENFSTTLTVSPHKNSAKIIDTGNEISDDKTAFLGRDFKENDGYKRSVELSKEAGLYRQNYCGCLYSKNN